ncbi:mitochondrial ribosomal protein subunit L20-domain-containing protein [Paraphysoderma sedebokerense]|nr:mitochondrial ribosomal protein subunit L20-domain-containing protein [Paraphysoderma sedebokerense]
MTSLYLSLRIPSARRKFGTSIRSLNSSAIKNLVEVPAVIPPNPTKLKPSKTSKIPPPMYVLPDGSTFHSRFHPSLHPEKVEISPDDLPPLSHPISPIRGSKHLAKEDIEQIRQLRSSDPDTWTVRKLAEKFKCSPIFVSIVAKCPEDRVKKLAEERQAKWERLSEETKREIKDRERRRLLW